ncbi:MAG: type I restriction-modification enzyme R subunit C-terminal domain-containing protein, partial [Thermomicrobiales bacterium]
QIRTVIQTFKAKLREEIFPGRDEVPKTLIFAKDDSHADDIVRIVREEFGKGNDFAQKITYRTTGRKPEDLLQEFRNSYNPRIVVTVDMIATGTDIKPLEIVMFMRAVRSRNFYEQMKGRGVRVIDDNDFQSVTPDAARKTHFVLVDCVGVTEQTLSDSPPLERNPSIPLDKLLLRVAAGSLNPDDLSTLAARLARLDRQLGAPQRATLAELAGGTTLQQIAGGLLDALDPDRQLDAARAANGLPEDSEPSDAQLAQATARLLREAAKPLAANPALRERIVDIQRQFEQTIDTLSVDEVRQAGFNAGAAEKARETVASFEAYIREHKDEITALQVLYSRRYTQRLRYRDIKALADAIAAPPRSWTPDRLWQAYAALDAGKVRGSAGTTLTNIVSLVRYATQQTDELTPFPEQALARYDAWLAQQAGLGRSFSAEQRRWLDDIAAHIAS